MNVEARIIGITGLSGVGKGYTKEYLKSSCPYDFAEPVVVTTRPARPTDGIDREAGISVPSFMQGINENRILFGHQPFGTDWYGFRGDSFAGTRPILTEVHVDNVIPFTEVFGARLYLLGLIADTPYLQKNLQSRATEDKKTQQLRLESAINESRRIEGLHQNGYIRDLIIVSELNRDRLGSLVADLAISFLH